MAERNGSGGRDARARARASVEFLRLRAAKRSHQTPLPTTCRRWSPHNSQSRHSSGHDTKCSKAERKAARRRRLTGAMNCAHALHVTAHVAVGSGLPAPCITVRPLPVPAPTARSGEPLAVFCSCRGVAKAAGKPGEHEQDSARAGTKPCPRHQSSSKCAPASPNLGAVTHHHLCRPKQPNLPSFYTQPTN
jgi:hypothetical protein